MAQVSDYWFDFVDFSYLTFPTESLPPFLLSMKFRNLYFLSGDAFQITRMDIQFVKPLHFFFYFLVFSLFF